MKGMIKARYPNLKGKDWINQLSSEDKAAVVALLMEACEHGHKGGLARAQNAQRDSKGRFKQETLLGFPIVYGHISETGANCKCVLQAATEENGPYYDLNPEGGYVIPPKIVEAIDAINLLGTTLIDMMGQMYKAVLISIQIPLENIHEYVRQMKDMENSPIDAIWRDRLENNLLPSGKEESKDEDDPGI